MVDSGRGRPPPLRLYGSSYTDNTPLEDIPPGPLSAHSLLQSPTSPVSPGSTFQSRRLSNSTIAPPQSKHPRRRTSGTPPPNRAPTPLQATAQRHALDDFAAACRAYFYHQDQAAEEKMTRRLATLRPQEKAQYTKLQANIRAAFHRDTTNRRRAEFRAHLTSTVPGGSLSPAARSDASRQPAERADRFAKFVATWCSPAFPGTTPFFDALYAVMRLQTLPAELGGAGDRRMEWEVDDAVFQEAAGKGFMLEAIDVLKGVLAFDESGDGRSPQASPAEPAQPLRTSATGAISSTTVTTSRPRAISDPFLDTPPQLSHSVPSSLSSPLQPQAALPAPGSSYASTLSALSPGTPENELDGDDVYIPPRPSELSLGLESPVYGVEDEEEDVRRVWVAPDLPNHEYAKLLEAFPSSVTGRQLPRFKNRPKAPAKRKRGADIDLEAGVEELVGAERETLRHGTGMLWLGDRARSPGWRSSWWQRLLSWWHRVFC